MVNICVTLFLKTWWVLFFHSLRPTTHLLLEILYTETNIPVGFRRIFAFRSLPPGGDHYKTTFAPLNVHTFRVIDQ